MPSELNNQVVGNVGLFYICYRLSRLGWNVMPTTRNARGVDIVIYSQDALQTHTVQVKALSKGSPVPLGRKVETLFGDYFIICRNVSSEVPECFILTPDEVRRLAHKGEKNGITSYWLQPKQYETDGFRERWERIGQGTSDLTSRLPKALEPAATVPLSHVTTMTQVRPEEIVEFVRSRGDMQLSTLVQKQSFVVRAVRDGLEYVPSSDKPRTLQVKELTRVCEEFSRTNSRHPGEYLDLTVSASYTIALIDAYLKTK